MNKLVIVLLVIVSIGLTRQCATNALLVEDFDYFISQYEAIHPDPYTRFGGKKHFYKTVESIREELADADSITTDQFVQRMSEFLVPLHDKHTRFGYYSLPEEADPKCLPITFRTITDGLIINGSLEHEWHLGCRLKAIDDVPLDSLLERMGRILVAENKFGLYANHSFLCQSSMLDMLLDTSNPDSHSISLQTPDGRDTTVVMKMYPSSDNLWRNGLYATKSTPVFRHKNFDHYFADDQHQIMVLRCEQVNTRDNIEAVHSIGSEEFQGYIDWGWSLMFGKKCDVCYDSAIAQFPVVSVEILNMLNEMKANDAKNLIIDLRNNNGGYTPVFYPALYEIFGDEYLTKDMEAKFSTRISEQYLKKNCMSLDQFNARNGSSFSLNDFVSEPACNALPTVNDSIRRSVIDGYMSCDKSMLYEQNGEPIYRPENIYVVTNERTFSAAFHIAFMFWKMGAKIIGVPSSQSPNTYMENTEFSLPNSGIQCSVSNSIQEFMPSDDIRSNILWPDIMMSYEDYKHYGFDQFSELMFTVDYIKSHQR